MPNWVNNSLTIKGEKNRIAEVRTLLESELEEGHFFKNIVSPKEGELDSYKSNIDPIGWYDWNIQHWGTKWDASEIVVVERTDEVLYGFCTAWSPPTNAMIALSEQFPDLDIHLRFVEEQGWGGEGEYKAGEESIVDEWDIPASHAESMKAQITCNCEWDNDEEEWFEDCPREEVLA